MSKLSDWLREHEDRREPVWVVGGVGLMTTLFTVDAEREDVTVERVCYADRIGHRRRPATRAGVTRYDFDVPQERFAADETTARELARILAHNGIHGWIRKAGDEEKEGF